MTWRRLAAGALAAFALAVRLADAKSTYDSPYGYEKTWNAALRLVRVDNGWKITEKDEASGYLLFEYTSPENAKPAPGSFELVRGREGDGVGVVLQIPRLPRYHEQVVLDALAAKMRREYGDPPVARRREPVPEPQEAGAGDVE